MPANEEADPRVSQASGIVSVQAQCTVEEALQLLKDRAQVSGQTLVEIATATLEHRIRFGPDT